MGHIMAHAYNNLINMRIQKGTDEANLFYFSLPCVGCTSDCSRAMYVRSPIVSSSFLYMELQQTSRDIGKRECVCVSESDHTVSSISTSR